MSMMVAMVPTANFGEILYIPVDGVLQVFEKNADPLVLLGNQPGKLVLLHVGKDVHAHFRATEDGTPNVRATVVLSRLTDVHVAFTGPVVFSGLTGPVIYEIVDQLSR